MTDALPLLRPDLEIVVGPSAADGGPTYTVYDPVPRRFSKVGWAEAMILERLRKPTTLPELKDDLERTTTLRVSDEELEALVKKAVGAGLTTSSLCLPVETLMERAAMRKTGIAEWLLKNYLYIRVPLIRPDAFLDATLGIARLFVSGFALFVYAVLGLFGLGFLLQNWAAYTSTFPYFFNLSGMFWYGASIVILKAIHEFSHAYTAKSAGVRVPVMGIAFIVLWPVAFCDVTDAWKLRDRRARFRIGAAGIVTEFIIAGLALFGWGISSPGVFNSICFVVSSASLLSTLMVNLNPAMSFDGYYMLMDIWGIDNLRPRAFNATRRLYRKYLLGMDLPPTEKGLTGRRAAAFAIYSIYSWLYRVVLYLGIAVFVYYKFTKTLGILLFAVEIWWFVFGPVFKEAKALSEMRSSMRMNPALGVLLLLFLGWVAWIGLPLERSITVPAVTVPEALQVVYAPADGTIERIHVVKGDTIQAGDPVVTLASMELDTELKTLEEQLAILEIEQDNLKLEEVDRALLPQKLEEIGQVSAELERLRKEESRLSVTAQTGGKVTWWDETLYPGRPVGRDRMLGRIIAPDRIMIRAFVHEDRISDISLADPGLFRPVDASVPVEALVKRISPARAETIEHSALTSSAQGIIPVAPDHAGRMRTIDTWYAVELVPETGTSSLLPGQSGTVRLVTKPTSLLVSWLRKAYRVLLRESGF